MKLKIYLINNRYFRGMKKKIAFLTIILFGFFSAIKAQVNTDSIFGLAINQAKNQQYNLAINEAKKAMEMGTKRGDILVFIANVYSWQNKNDSAMLYIHDAQNLGYKHNDFFESWTNILLRTHQYEALLKSCDEAEKDDYSNSEDILKKRLISLTELKVYDKGIKLIEEPQNKKYLDFKPFNDLYSYLILKRNTNLISVYYIEDFFNNGLIPQYLASLGYSFKIGEHNLGLSANYANRFGLNDVQLETNIYLILKNKQYLYLNYGFAFYNSLFPKHRGGLEYYVPLPFKMSASIGGRYLYYQTTNSNIFILTGHLEKYLGKSWISVRPYYVYNYPSGKESYTLIGNYRIFGKSELYYWGIELGFGNSPDEKYSTSQTNGFNQLKAYKIKFEKNFMLNNVSDLHIALGYSSEEYKAANIIQSRKRFTVELGYKLRLK